MANEPDEMIPLKDQVYELQKLLVNVRGWVREGRSETAVRNIDEAMREGWQILRRTFG